MGKPRKTKLGQHFLIDKTLIRFMVEAADLTRGDIVLEVGAGYGSLTAPLASSSGKVIAVERDPSLFRILSEKLVEFNNVELLRGDVFSVKVPRFDKVVSSLPYCISAKFVKWLLRRNFKLCILVLQKEFASKLASEPGSRKYCSLTALARHEMDVSILEYISPTAFSPPPKVTSCVVKLNRMQPLYSIDRDFQFFYEDMVNYLFSQKRKLVRSAVRRFIESLDLTDFNSPISTINNKRVYELSVEELDKLARTLYEVKHR